MVDLIRDGLAAASAERMVAGGKSIEIARVKITDAAGGRLQRTIHNKTEEEEKNDEASRYCLDCLVPCFRRRFNLAHPLFTCENMKPA
jgi:hypothetical protein